LLTACQSNPADNTAITAETLSTSVYFDTLEINNLKNIQVNKDGRFNCLLSARGDTIVKSNDYFFKAEFPDIDEDGSIDIRISVMSNTPNQCENYLFDKTGNTFRLVENCDLDIKKINGTAFYYSYNRAGCADMNWESHLSKIKNYQLVNYGYMNGQGCDADIKKNPQVIEIYKVSNFDTRQRTMVKSIPYTNVIIENNDKWDFIENYWRINCEMFEQ
jgi:hypothetical protein